MFCNLYGNILYINNNVFHLENTNIYLRIYLHSLWKPRQTFGRIREQISENAIASRAEYFSEYWKGSYQQKAERLVIVFV